VGPPGVLGETCHSFLSLFKQFVVIGPRWGLISAVHPLEAGSTVYAFRKTRFEI
jgi:hypothetical protein